MTSIQKLLIGGFKKKRNRSHTSTGARPDQKVRFILGQLFDTWSWQPNDRKLFWLDGIESYCVGVEGSSKSISVRRFSPSALFLFRFHLSPFSPETPDTQATNFCALSPVFSAYIIYTLCIEIPKYLEIVLIDFSETSHSRGHWSKKYVA